ncbi:MAG: GIY-YIG nuclease family protein [Pseudomonadota bacterium]
MPGWHLYLIRCRDNSLYTGIATDVARRFAEHQSGRGARYLRGRGPLALALSRAVGDRILALRLEHRVKKLPKGRKERLLADPGELDRMLLRLSEQSSQ